MRRSDRSCDFRHQGYFRTFDIIVLGNRSVEFHLRALAAAKDAVRHHPIASRAGSALLAEYPRYCKNCQQQCQKAGEDTVFES